MFQEREAQTVRHLTLRVVHKQNRASQKSSRFKTPSDLVDDASHGVNGDGESEKKSRHKKEVRCSSSLNLVDDASRGVNGDGESERKVDIKKR